MNTLYGYVRELQFDSDTCTVCVPNLYYRRFDKMLEARIEIDNLGKELVDYLEKQGRLLKDQIDGTNNLPFRIISLPLSGKSRKNVFNKFQETVYLPEFVIF